MHVLLVARAHHHQRHQHHHYPGEPSPRWKCAVSGNFLGDIASWGAVDRHSSSSIGMNSSSCLASAYTAARATSQLTLPSPSLPPPLPSRRPCSWSSNTRIFYSDYTPTPAHPQNSGDYFARARTCIGAWMGSSQFTRTACVLYAKVSAREGFSHKLYRDSERSPSTVVQTREEEDNIFFFKRRF